MLLSLAGRAEDNVFLNLKNIYTNEDIDNVVVYVDVGGRTFTKPVGVGDSLGLELADGEYTITLKIDKTATSGRDFFKRQQISVVQELSEQVFLFPVGSLRGMVKDTFDNVVGNAELEFECTNEIGAAMPQATNKFGSFAVDYMPVGSCKVFASFEGAVGFTDATVGEGDIVDVEIMLENTILASGRKDYTVQIVVGLLFAIAVLLLLFRLIRKLKPRVKHKVIVVKSHPKHESHSSEKEEKGEETNGSSRAEDIKSTLGKKERDIIDYLLSKKEQVNQSSIRHNTGIPRTSLTRILASLEHKKIIHIKKEGKVLKISLTDWFLGKD